MGMTIDTAIDVMENPKDYFPKDIDETSHFIVETMYKYQKIEHLFKQYKITYMNELGLTSEFENAICEVIEDGNDD